MDKQNKSAEDPFEKVCELRKQFKVERPETVGETDVAFDNSNFIDWLLLQLATLQQANAELQNELDDTKRQRQDDMALAKSAADRVAELEKQNAELIGFVKRFHNYTCVQSSGQVRIIDPELVVTEGDQLKYMAQELLIQSHESNKG